MLSKKHFVLIWRHHKFYIMTYLTLPFYPQSSEQTILMLLSMVDLGVIGIVIQKG